jgi:2-polyprenyl-6-methoxyphenol hydroxylase-like FAD-dependent oxidoreductase
VALVRVWRSGWPPWLEHEGVEDCKEKRRVVIIGGGIGGLTTAIALRSSGMDVHVYEQAPELGEVGAGVGLWPNAFRALERLGLIEKVLAISAGPIGTGVRRPDGQ